MSERILPEYIVIDKPWSVRENDGLPCFVIERWVEGAGGRTITRFTDRTAADRVAEFLNANAEHEWVEVNTR